MSMCEGVRVCGDLHVNVDVVGVIVSSVEFDVKGGICVIRVFPVKDVHLHLIMIT